MSIWHLYFHMSALWRSNALTLDATDCLNYNSCCEAWEGKQLINLLNYFFFPSSVKILVRISLKIIALKFADPLVKQFLLTCPLRTWLSDWDHQSHLLWSSPHISAQSPSSTNNVIFVQLHTTLFTTTLTVFKLADTFIFNMKFLFVKFSHLFVQHLTQTWVPMLESVNQQCRLKGNLGFKAPRKHLVVQVLTTCYSSSHCCFPLSLLLKSEVETDMTT